MSCLPGHCRTSEEMKYTMTRLAMDGVDLFIVEHGCAANIKVACCGTSPVFTAIDSLCCEELK